MARALPWKYDDGGRSEAGFRAQWTTDCICRAIAIVLERPYRDVYDMINDRCRVWFPVDGISKHSARTGIPTPLLRELLADLGLRWVPTMSRGTGVRVHMRPGELPERGRLIARMSRHVAAVIDGVVHDTYDPCRNGTRAVYGYWLLEEEI